MSKGIITRKQLITDEALTFGTTYAKNVEIAIKTNKELVASVIELNKVIAGFKVSDSSKEFLKMKESEIKLSKQIEELLKKESQTRLSLEKEKQAAITTAKKEIELALKKEQQQRKNNKLTIDERISLQQKNKAARQDAILTNKLVGAYQKLNLERTKAKQTLQDNIVLYGKSNTKTKQAQAEFDRLDKKVKTADAAVRDFSKNVGNYPNNVGRATASLKKLAAALGVVGGVTLLAREIKKSVDIVRVFELQIATLGGISGATEKQLESLRKMAVHLGSTTEFTATQVAELQTEFARLGFVPEIIEAITAPTLQAATALETDLAGAAKLVGGTLKSFELDASKAAQVADVLASATTKSALDFEKLSTGLAIVAPVAKNANVSLEKTSAQLGVLSDRNVDASTAATGLRNIFLETAKRGITVEAAFKKINESSNKNATAMALFGKRGATVATILAENEKQTEKLTVALLESGGAAEELADKKLATLDGSLKLLSSAWEGFILKLNDTTGAGNTLSKGILFLAENLDTIISVIGYATGAWVLYKVAVFSANKAMVVYNAGSKALAVTQAFLNGGLKKVIATFRVLNAVSKANVFGAIVVAITALIIVYKQLSKEISASEKAQKSLNKARETAKKSVAGEKAELKSLIDIARNENLSKEDRLKAIKKINEISPEYLGNITLENIATEEGARLLNDYTEALNKKALAQAISNKRAELAKKLIDQESTGLEENTSITDKATAALLSLGNASLYSHKIALQGVESKQKNTKAIEDEIKAFDKLTKKLLEAGKINIDDVLGGNDDDSGEDDDKKLKEAQKAAKERYELRKKEEKALLELTKFRLQQEIKLSKETLDNEEKTGLERVIASEIISAKRKEITTLETEFILKHLGEFSNEKLRFIQELSNEEISQIIANNGIKSDLQNKLSSEQLLIIEKFQAKKKEIESQSDSEQESLTLFDEKKFKKQLDAAAKARETALNNELTAENNRFNALSELERKREQATGAHEKKIAEIKKKHAKEALNVQLLAIEELLKASNLSTEQRAEYERQLSKIKLEISQVTTEGIVENEKVSAEQILDISGQLSSALGNLANAIFDGKIQKIDEEITKNEEYYNRQLELAGEDEVQKDLIRKEAKKKEDALNAKKRKEQRKQAVLNKAMAVVDAGIATALGIMQAYAQMGPIGGSVGAALVGALGAINIAAILAKPIPKYAKGTDFHPGGLATVGEERPEVISEPNKAPYIVSKETTLDLPRGTKVVKSLEDYKKLINASSMRGLDSENRKLNEYQAKLLFTHNNDNQNIEDAIEKGFKKAKINIINQQKGNIDIPHEVWKGGVLDW